MRNRRYDKSKGDHRTPQNIPYLDNDAELSDILEIFGGINKKGELSDTESSPLVVPRRIEPLLQE
jgi:hypothetical protein